MESAKRFFITYVRLLKLAWRVHAKLLVVLTVFSASWGLTNLPVLYLNKALIDLVISSVGKSNYQQILQSLVWLIALRTLLEVVRSLLSRSQNGASSSLASLISDRLTIIMGEKLNSLDIPTVESAGFQDKFTKVERQANQRIWGMLSALTDFPNAITTVISGIIPILQFNPLISLLVFVISLPDVFVNAKLAKLEYIDREVRNRQYRALGWLDWIVTDTHQFYENKILGNVNYVLRKMKLMQDDIYGNDFRQRTRRITWRSIADIPSWLTSAGLNIYFFLLAIGGKITLGSAQLLYQSSQTFSNGITSLFNNVSTIYEHYLFVNDYTWFMDLQPSFKLGEIPFPAKISQGIKFDHVWFKYPESENWVLQDVSFTLDPTDNLAIVGENGAGKTTLLKLLLGFYLPTKGSITIDSVAITDYLQTSFWHQVAILQQEFHLFPFSARESIAFSDLDRVNDMANIKSAAQKANIDEYISSLPKGYETPLTKQLDGVDPSGGQKQRVAIARTLFKKSQLMILDEPTSNVDPKAEEEIFKNIIEVTKDQILILVSHRFSTVRRADKIMLLEAGQLAEMGTHEQLLDKQGIYAKLFTLQAKNYQ